MIRDQRGTYCAGMRTASRYISTPPTYRASTLVTDALIALNASGIRGLYEIDDNAAMEAARTLLVALGVTPIEEEE